MPISRSRNQEFNTDLINESGAIHKGHFKLASSRHSDTYIEKFRILEKPQDLKLICEDIKHHFYHEYPDIIVGPATGGILVAYELACQFYADAVYVETENGKRILKRDADIPYGSRILLVDDVLTTGISLKETLAAIQHFNLN